MRRAAILLRLAVSRIRRSATSADPLSWRLESLKLAKRRLCGPQPDVAIFLLRTGTACLPACCSVMDDIKGETPLTETAKTAPDHGAESTTGHHSVGPESEVRGGSEAPSRTVDEAPKGQPPAAQPYGVPGLAGQRPDGVPGNRAPLPEGSLSATYLAAQGDENRQPPSNAPAPVNPAVTVDDPPRPEDPDAAQ